MLLKNKSLSKSQQATFSFELSLVSFHRSSECHWFLPNRSVPGLRRLRTHWILDNSSPRMAACPRGPPGGLACIALTASRAGKPGSEAARRAVWGQLSCFSSSSMPRNCSRAVSRLSTISRTRTAGSGRLSESSRLSSFNQKISRLALFEV